jgi:hypothetical protein
MATNSFESKFSILAEAQLHDKLPAAGKYALGFQVVAAEDDNERALGVMAYRIGDRHVLVPVFWLNGKVKGGDIMFLKEDNQFLPFTEIRLNWVETGRKFSFGELTDKGSREGGPYRVSTLELNWLHSKRAGDVGVFDVEDCRPMAVMATDRGNTVSLAEHLSLFSPKAAADFADMLVGDAALANAIFEHYTPSEIGEVIGKRIQAGMPAAKTAAEAAVIVIKDRDDPDAAILDEAGKIELATDGVVVVDNRQETSTAFVARDARESWVTPSESGVYMALADGYDTKKLVICTGVRRPSPRNVDSDDVYPLHYKNEDALVADTEAKTWSLCSSDALPLVDASKGAMDEPIGEAVSAEVLRSILEKAIIRDKDLFGRDKSGYKAEYAKAKILLIDGKQAVLCDMIRGEGGKLVIYEDAGRGLSDRTIILTGRPGTLGQSEAFLYVPSGARVLDLTGWTRQWGPSSYVTTGPSQSALSQAGYTTVKVAHDGRRWSVGSSDRAVSGVNYADAVEDLVLTYGLSGKQAKELLETSTKSPVSVYVKQAAETFRVGTEAFGDDHTKTYEVAGGPTGLTSDSSARIQAAAKTGVREVLDTKILSEMAKSAYPVDKIMDTLPTLTKALDRLCRNLFYFYWHNEAMGNRYGENNLESLEDALKDNIQSLDDLIMYLQEKDTATSEELRGGDREDDLTDEMR